ncbi:MAG TPA: Hsp20/alpha crystallin family protein [Dehalococcoidia bacterium]|nr:Hsp20/alpha crystallin family protein [Dehalococcoidia bacterium]
MATESEERERRPWPFGPRSVRRWFEEADPFRVRFERRWPFISDFLAQEPWEPAVDMIEKDGKLIVKADLPGVKREDIDVTVERGALRIRAERRQEKDVREEDYRRVERTYGRYERVLPLPEGIDPESISASCKDGVLEVVMPLPKAEAAEAKKVPIGGE